MENKDQTNQNEELMKSSNADEDNGIVDKKTLKKYRIHWYNRIPYPVKALFIKYWFFGLVYFLFMNGLGSLPVFQGGSQFSMMTLVLILITGIACGVFDDLLVYNILDVIEDYPGQKDSFVIFKSRKFYSIFVNVVYGVFLCIVSLYLCARFSSWIDPSLSSYWFREPFSAALVIFVLDGIFVSIKDGLVHLFRRGKQKDGE